ncbi:MAG: major capsid protein [Magnetospirillum sp. WYHS-4]
MPTLDIFNNDAFSAVQLTGAVEKIPYRPQFLGSLGIFDPVPVRTTTIAIEKRENTLALIKTSDRGAPLEEGTTTKRDIRDFRTTRIAKGDRINADEVQNMRASGSETELQTVQAEVAGRMERLKEDMELTWENMRLGAVQGIVTDADGSVLMDWYDAWGINQPAEINFALDQAATDVRKKCAGVVRSMTKVAKGAWGPGVRIHALCGDAFYDDLIGHEAVKETYRNWAAAADLRQNMAFESFPFGGIVFHNFRGTDDDTTLAIGQDKAKFFPVGARGVFQTAWSPAEFFDFVNTPGRDLYAITIPDRDRNAWVRVELYSYPLFICTRPEMLLRAKRA